MGNASYESSTRYKFLEDLKRDSVDLCLTYCGWEQCNPSYRFGPNRREAYVLHMIKKGKGILEIGNKKYELQEGDAFLIVPGQEAWYEADKDDPWCYMWFGFIGLKAGEYINGGGLSAKNPVRRIQCMDIISEYIDQILEAYHLTYANELKRNGLLMLCFSALIDDYRQNFSGFGAAMNHSYPMAVYVKYAIEYMTAHYSERIKINELADYIGVHRSYLTSSFKKSIGCSPQEFLVNLRIEKAKSLLVETDDSINAVANLVGYTDPLAFSKVFRQKCGMSPRRYREEEKRLAMKR